MKFAIVTCLFACLVAAEPLDYHNRVGVPLATRLKRSEDAKHTRIIGGFYSYLGQHPFFGGLIITLSTSLTSVCGSTLVSTTTLVTAAHCWRDGVSSGQQIQVVLGSIKLFSGGTRFTTDSVTIHPSFDAETWENDIAIVHVPQPIETSYYIRPITLPDRDDGFSDSAIAVGFGKNGDWAGITVDQPLMMHYLTVIDEEECGTRYGYSPFNETLCTDGGSDRSPCDGDAGGPLYYYNEDYTQKIFIGVMSFGSRYGCRVGHPYVHTKVAFHLDFIKGTN